MSWGKSKANTFMRILEKDRESHIIFVFDFINEYIASFLFPLIAWIIIGILIGLSEPESFLSSIYICFLPGIFSGFIGLAIFKWEVPKKKSRFMEDIDKYFRFTTSPSIEGIKFCVHCGAEIDSRAEICPKCGVRQPKLVSGEKWSGGTMALLILATIFIPLIKKAKERQGALLLVLGILMWVGWTAVLYG